MDYFQPSVVLALRYQSVVYLVLLGMDYLMRAQAVLLVLQLVLHLQSSVVTQAEGLQPLPWF
jgi:hypothetical protein